MPFAISGIIPIIGVLVICVSFAIGDTLDCVHLAEDRSGGLGPSPGPGLRRILAEPEKRRGWSGENGPIVTINTGLQRLVPENPLPSLPDLRCRPALAFMRQLEQNKNLFRSGLEIRRPQVPAHRPACEVEVPEHLSQRQPTSQTKQRNIGENKRSVYDLGQTRNRQTSVFSGTNRWTSI